MLKKRSLPFRARFPAFLVLVLLCTTWLAGCGGTGSGAAASTPTPTATPTPVPVHCTAPASGYQSSPSSDGLFCINVPSTATSDLSSISQTVLNTANGQRFTFNTPNSSGLTIRHILYVLAGPASATDLPTTLTSLIHAIANDQGNGNLVELPCQPASSTFGTTSWTECPGNQDEGHEYVDTLTANGSPAFLVAWGVQQGKTVYLVALLTLDFQSGSGGVIFKQAFDTLFTSAIDPILSSFAFDGP